MAKQAVQTLGLRMNFMMEPTWVHPAHKLNVESTVSLILSMKK